MRIKQLNCHRSPLTIEALFNDFNNSDILLLQEPGVRIPHHPAWYTICASWEERARMPRAVTYVRKGFVAWHDIEPDADLTDPDFVAIRIKDITLINLYNQTSPDRDYGEGGGLSRLRAALDSRHRGPILGTVIAGDYNIRHAYWDSRHPFTNAGDELMNWFHRRGMVLSSPPDVPTHRAGNVLDLVFASLPLITEIYYDGAPKPGLSDHFEIDWRLDTPETDNYRMDIPVWDYKHANWPGFATTIKETTEVWRKRSLDTEMVIDDELGKLCTVVTDALEANTKRLRITERSKRWWNADCTAAYERARFHRRLARLCHTPAAERRAARSTNEYHRLIRKVKAAHWTEFLKTREGPNIWVAYRYTQPTPYLSLMPAIRKPDGTLTQGTQEKFSAIRAALLPSPPPSDALPPLVVPDANWPNLTEVEVSRAVHTIASDKAPGPDGLKAHVYQASWKVETFRTIVTNLLSACVALGYHPQRWRDSRVVVLKKPGRRDRREAKSYRPISLLCTLGKILEKIVHNRLAYLTCNHLPDEQYGARPGYSAPDAVLHLVNDIKASQSAGSALMIDIKGAFDNVNLGLLLREMEVCGLPSAARRWCYHFLTGRSAAFMIDGKVESSKPVQTGIPQGSPISPLLFMIYTRSLYAALRTARVKCIGFVDDITIYVTGNNFSENAARLGDALRISLEWAAGHFTAIDLGDKLGYMHFQRARGPVPEDSLKLPNGEIRHPSPVVKLLGIYLDTRLNFKAHYAAIERKAEMATQQIFRLGGCYRGVSGTAYRQMYLACVRTHMEYGIEVWYNHEVRNNLQTWESRLQVIQNKSLRKALGAVSRTHVDLLHMECGVLPINLRLRQVYKHRAIRVKYQLANSNPLVKAVENYRDTATPIGRLMRSIEHLTIEIPEYPPRTVRPPWQNTSNSEMDSQLTTIAGLRKRVVQDTLTQWQEDFDASSDTLEFRERLGEAKCHTRLSLLMLKNQMRHAPRHILSRIVQFRTGTALVGSWFQANNVRNTHINCTCGALETVDHILKFCPLTSGSRRGLLKASPSLSDKVLLNTPEGLTAVAAFLADTWKSQNRNGSEPPAPEAARVATEVMPHPAHL